MTAGSASGKICRNHLLDRTRRAWVAPARDGRYVLGQLRSRTAGVSFLSFWDGVCRHNRNDQKIEKSRFFLGPGNSFLGRDSSVFFGTLKIDCSNTANNMASWPAHIFWVFCSFFPYTQILTNGWTLDRLKLRFLNKKRRRCAPAQL